LSIKITVKNKGEKVYNLPIIGVSVVDK